MVIKDIKWPIDPKDACPRGVRSELWLTDQEYSYISDTLKGTGFMVERIDETPRKSTAASVSQVSLRSSNVSSAAMRQRSSPGSTSRISGGAGGGTRVRPVSHIHNGGKGDDDHLSESERNEYRRLVQLIIRTHKSAAQPFLFPVPETVIGYYDVIKKPSDLTTIRQRLDSNAYVNRSEFERDFLQMVWNAYVFNPPQSEVFKSAMELHSAFIEGLQKSVLALNDLKRSEGLAQIEAARRERRAALLKRNSSVGGSSFDKTHGGSKSSASNRASNVHKKSSTEEELRKKLEYLQKVVSRQSAAGQSVHHRGGSKTPSPPINNVRPLTDKQLDQLASDLEQLDPKHVAEVAKILHGEPTANVAGGTLDVTIQDLPANKQRELLNLIDKLKAADAFKSRITDRVREYGSEDSDYENGEHYSKRYRV